LSGLGVSIFFSLLDRECRQRPRPFSMFFLQFFGRLVGSAAGHFRDFFFFFTGSARCRRANGRVVNIGRLVGSAAGHFRDFFFFFHRFGSVSKSKRSRGQHWGVTSESLRFAFPFFCLVVAFRESEEFLVRKGRKLYFQTSCRQG
jgi:hypothetical protein